MRDDPAGSSSTQKLPMQKQMQRQNALINLSSSNMNIKLPQTDQHQHACPKKHYRQAKRGARQYDHDTNCSALSASYCIYLYFSTYERAYAIIKHDQRLEIRIRRKGIQSIYKITNVISFPLGFGRGKILFDFGGSEKKKPNWHGIGSRFPFPIPIPIWTDMHARD